MIHKKIHTAGFDVCRYAHAIKAISTHLGTVLEQRVITQLAISNASPEMTIKLVSRRTELKTQELIYNQASPELVNNFQVRFAEFQDLVKSHFQDISVSVQIRFPGFVVEVSPGSLNPEINVYWSIPGCACDMCAGCDAITDCEIQDYATARSADLFIADAIPSTDNIIRLTACIKDSSATSEA